MAVSANCALDQSTREKDRSWLLMIVDFRIIRSNEILDDLVGSLLVGIVFLLQDIGEKNNRKIKT